MKKFILVEFLVQPAIVSKYTLNPNLLKYRNQLFGFKDVCQLY